MENDDNDSSFNDLTPEEESIIIHKGTESSFTGKYDKHKEIGTYVCKRCDAKLFTSSDKFQSNCGWPSFDDAIAEAVKTLPDADGVRTEILCANCDGHLGHVFSGEGLTPKDTRHCVNSLSLNFIKPPQADEKQKAYFAGGCFWGVEHFFQKAPGVISTQVGYMGGQKANPTYEEVCSGTTGYAETMEVVYDPNETDFETLAKLFFEIHDPEQVNRQGPDVGTQYRSVVFYNDSSEKEIATKLIDTLKKKGYKVATEIAIADKFWLAEDYHQQYYEKKKGLPYCHSYQKRF
ncbi:MAG TPA: bifunctional methionine sulfoxide reductase B/A protein [Phycisphaerales bacterium]|nr:bifunctional methionine sulfoxide reductase B/A protein [Phycisphaerales bacterium]